MRIRLKGFRCYAEEFTLDLPETSLILLKGASGAGKSTLFQGLAWCLYGGMQHVFNHRLGTQRCFVEVTLPEITVYRQKRPELLRVTYRGQTHEDAAAQGIIEQVFGTKEVWYACCYVPQNGRNLLLSAGNAEKMRLIQQLSFSTDDPSAYLERIEADLSQRQQSLAVKQAIYSKECELLSAAITSANLDMSLYLAPEDARRVTLSRDLEEAQRRLVQLRQLEAHQHHLQGQYDALIRLEGTLGSGEDAAELEKNLQNLEERATTLRNQLAAAQVYTQYQELQAKLQDFTDLEGLDFDETDLIRVTQLQEQRRQGELTLQKYGLTYSSAAIEAELQRLARLRQTLDLRYTEQDLITATQQWEQWSQGRALLAKYNVAYAESARKEAQEQVRRQLTDLPPWTDEDLSLALTREATERRSRDLLAKYGLEYTEAAVKTARNRLEFLQAVDHLRGALQSYAELEQALQEPPLEPVTPEALRELDERIAQSRVSAAVLRCPHCHQGVRYYEGRLHSSALSPLSPRHVEELLIQRQELETRYHRQEQRRRTEQRLSQLRQELEQRWSQLPILAQFVTSLEELRARLATYPPFPPEVLSDLQQVVIVERGPRSEDIRQQLHERRRLQTLLSELEAVTILPEPIPLDVIRSSLAQRREHDRLLQVETELRSLTVHENLVEVATVRRVLERKRLIAQCEQLHLRLGAKPECELATLEAELAQTQATLQDFRQRLARVREIDRRRAEVQNQLACLTPQLDRSYETLIPACEKEITRYHQQRRVIERYDDLVQRRRNLEALQKEVYETHRDVVQLERLKTIAAEVECYTLQVTVDSINQVLNEIATYLFDDPITIRLSLFKPLKTKEKVKPVVNLTILYRGGEYDNINQLSGGEADRVSLILTLALSRLCSFPLLLFDESLASLDGNLKEAAVRAIRSATRKSVVCINHEGVEGLYDHQIELG